MYLFLKRLIDVVLSSIAILMIFPFMIPIVLALLLTAEHRVFYLQTRVGYKNKTFSIYKFASMLKDSPNMKGGIITTKGDPRITLVGAFLRKTKINELPQLINILIGDMSIVGPRPVMQKSFDQYPPDVQEVIYNVKPGLSGIGSLIFRDEEELITEIKNRGEDTWDFYRNKIYPFKGLVEKWYQKNQSLWVDVKIIVATVWVVLFPSSDIVYKWFKDLPERPF